jgi:hypothetical protein
MISWDYKIKLKVPNVAEISAYNRKKELSISAVYFCYSLDSRPICKFETPRHGNGKEKMENEK